MCKVQAYRVTCAENVNQFLHSKGYRNIESELGPQKYGRANQEEVFGGKGETLGFLLSEIILRSCRGRLSETVTGGKFSSVKGDEKKNSACAERETGERMSSRLALLPKKVD